jgi:hypothetical protein
MEQREVSGVTRLFRSLDHEPFGKVFVFWALTLGARQKAESSTALIRVTIRWLFMIEALSDLVVRIERSHNLTICATENAS